MRMKMAYRSVLRMAALAMSISVFASARAAERPAQDDQAQTPPEHGGGQAAGQEPIGPGVMGPEMMRRMESMMGRPRAEQGRGRGIGGTLRKISLLLAALDNPQFQSRVGLSEQQADNLRKIIVDAETYTITTGASILADSIEERELLRADHPDKGAIMDKGNQISKSMSQLIDHWLTAMLDAKAMLTPEQQRMFRAYMERGAVPRPAARP
jgi:Heavy-metal resistance